MVTKFNDYEDPGNGSLISLVSYHYRQARNVSSSIHVIPDIRGEEDSYMINSVSIQVYKHTRKETVFGNHEKLKNNYLLEVEEISKSA